MSYNKFESGTAIDPYQINQNFHHVGVGDLLPRGGASLEPTDGVNDLGATATSYAVGHFRDVINESITSQIDSSRMWNFSNHFVLTATASSIEFSSTDWESGVTTDMEIYMAGQYRAGTAAHFGTFFVIDRSSTATYYNNNSYWSNTAGVQRWWTNTSGGVDGWVLGTPGVVIPETTTSFITKMNIRTYDGGAAAFRIQANWDMAIFQETGVINLNHGYGIKSGVGQVDYLKFVPTDGTFQPGTYVGIWRRR